MSGEVKWQKKEGKKLQDNFGNSSSLLFAVLNGREQEINFSNL